MKTSLDRSTRPDTRVVMDPTGEQHVTNRALLARPAGIEGRTVVIGAKGFTEQYILAALLERVLEDAGAEVEIKGEEHLIMRETELLGILQG